MMGNPAAKAELDTRRTQWLVGDWHGLTKTDIAQLEDHPNRADIALYLASAQTQIGDQEGAQATIETAQHWGVDQNTLAKIALSGVATTLSKASALLGNADKMQAWAYRALCFEATEEEARLLQPSRLTEHLKQLGFLAPTDTPEWSSKITRPEEQFTLPTEAVRQKQKLKKVTAHLAKNNTDAAESLLEEILLEQPDLFTAMQELAKIKENKNNWVEAEKIYSRLLKEQSLTIKAVILRSRVLRKQGRLKETVNLLDNSLKTGLYDSHLLHQLAVAQRDVKNNREAYSLIIKIINEDPDYSINQLSFAAFAADFLRKKRMVAKGYTILKVAIKEAEKYRDIPSKYRAILEELKSESNKKSYSSEVSKSFYDDIYSYSEAYQKDAHNSVYLPVWQEVVKILKQRRINSVLDIGCGPGQFAHYLLEEIPNINYTGVDYSEVAINLAKSKNLNADFYAIDIMESDVLGKYKVDAYIILEVLEHIEKDLDLLNKIPKKSEVVFSVPSFDSFGHVRFFLDKNSVLERYKSIGIIRYFKEIEIESASKIYLTELTL